MSEVTAPEIPAIARKIEAACKVPPPEKLFTGVGMGFYLTADQLLPAAQVMLDEEYFLEDLAAVDVQEGILVNYHFDRFDCHERVVFRVFAPHEDPRIPSIVGIFTGADWHERECYDFFGLIFEGHPNLKPLLLPDDMEVRPLLKTGDQASVYDILPMCRLVDRSPEGGEGEKCVDKLAPRSKAAPAGA